MSIAASVAPELPMLRRFARLVAGSQASGDAYVLATLEALSAEPSAFPTDLAPRPALYKTFVQLWTSALPPTRFAAFDLDPKNAAERNLNAVTPLPRQAFLLRAVEGFSLAEVAAILDTTPGGASNLIAQAGREIAEQVATDVLIIEDEPIIAFDIEAMVQELGHEVTGIARTHAEAIESMRLRRPGLVLADILLADGSSGFGGGQRDPGVDRRAGDFHHGLPRTPADRRKARAHLSHHQAVPGRHGSGDDQPGAVLRRSIGRRARRGRWLKRSFRTSGGAASRDQSDRCPSSCANLSAGDGVEIAQSL